MGMSRIPGKESISHSFVHSFTYFQQAPLGQRLPHTRGLPPGSIPMSHRLLHYVLRMHCCFAGGAPLRRKFSRKSEVFNALAASAASPGPWTPPTFAFTPSGPKKALSKRESPITQRLVSHAFGASTERIRSWKEPSLGPTVYKTLQTLVLRKSLVLPFH